MPKTNDTVVFHFDNNKPLAYNEQNIQFTYEESTLRVKKKLDFIIETFLMRDVAFAFDISHYDLEDYALRASRQYAIAATFFIRKEQHFPLTPREQEQKEMFVRHASATHLQELLD